MSHNRDNEKMDSKECPDDDTQMNNNDKSDNNNEPNRGDDKGHRKEGLYAKKDSPRSNANKDSPGSNANKDSPGSNANKDSPGSPDKNGKTDDGSSKSSGIGRDSTLALSIDPTSMESLPPDKQPSEYESWLTLASPVPLTRPQHLMLPGRNDDRDSIDSSTMDVIFSQKDLNDIKKTSAKSKIPDGGWGWMVVLSSLVISMIADGVSFSFGLLYIEFLNAFGESKSKTAWIGSLFMAVPLLSGPVMSALVDRYGCRKMTILGGLVSGMGFVLSWQANSIEVMYLTFGLLAGLGLGLCYVTAVVSIAYWFDKKRTLAVGLGACGSGIGTFVYAPMTTYFIEEYGWRGTCLLLAGTFFNLIVCGTVMRDPEWWLIEQNREKGITTPKKSIARSEGGRSYSALSTEDFPGVDELRRLLKSGKAPEYHLQSLRTSTQVPANNHSAGGGFRSVVNLPTFVKQSEKVIN